MKWSEEYINKRCNRLYVDNQFSNYNTSLFHYTSVTSGNSILQSKELWLTKYNLSNDELEFVHGLRIILCMLKELMAKDEKTQLIYKNFVPFLEGEIKNPKGEVDTPDGLALLMEYRP